MQKNDFVTVTVEDMGVGGEGIGKIDGYALFIKDAVIGDVVQAKIMKMKKTYGYAKLMDILSPSKYRVKPRCPAARQCGGCQIQALCYEKQLAFKKDKVRNNLARIGEVPDEILDSAMEPIRGMQVKPGEDMPYRYRNKAQFPIRADKNGKIVAGFYAGRTHQIIPNMDCVLGVSQNEEILKIIIDFMEKHHISAYDEIGHRGLVRHVLIRYGFRTKEIMVCLVLNGNRLPWSDELTAELRRIPGMASIALNVNKERTNVILGPDTRLLWGQAHITDYIGDVKYQISPSSFYQVNPVQTEKLYGIALEYAGLRGTEIVWDLYCGIGTISLFLAQKARKVYGVEIVPQAVEDARRNAAINGIENVEFYMGKAEEILPRFYSRHGCERADVIVVDPPRKGCEQILLKTMADMGPDRIVYVSCDSATLARDVKYLRGRGYEVERICAVDMFPHTVHVETVVRLQRKHT